jgi:hypothetical protein
MSSKTTSVPEASATVDDKFDPLRLYSMSSKTTSDQIEHNSVIEKSGSAIRMRYLSLNVDLEKLATEIQVYLKDKDFEVRYFRDHDEPPTWFSIEATKSTKLRTIAGMSRSLEIRIGGESNNFDVSLTTGQWRKNAISTGLASLPASIVTGGVTTIAAVGTSFYMSRKFRNDLWKFISQQTENLKNTGRIR